MCLNLLLLLFCLIKYSESSAEGNNLIPVKGNKRENVTLQCKSEDREITRIVLNRLSKKILVCEKEECESENDRVFKEGSCDIIIKNLSFSDAGKYILRVYFNNDQTEEKYHLHIYDEISVKKGEDLKLDVLLINADKVERNSGSGWTELWTRGHGVNSDRMTVSDETLIIHEFTDTDTGTYRVLDSEGETWITVTELNTGDNHKPIEQHVEIIVPSVCGALLLALLGVIVIVLIRNNQPENRNADPGDYQAVPMAEIQVVQNI